MECEKNAAVKKYSLEGENGGRCKLAGTAEDSGELDRVAAMRVSQ